MSPSEGSVSCSRPALPMGRRKQAPSTLSFFLGKVKAYPAPSFSIDAVAAQSLALHTKHHAKWVDTSVSKERAINDNFGSSSALLLLSELSGWTSTPVTRLRERAENVPGYADSLPTSADSVTSLGAPLTGEGRAGLKTLVCVITGCGREESTVELLLLF